MPRAVPGALFYISVTDVLPRQVILKWTPEGNKKVLGIYGEIQVQAEGRQMQRPRCGCGPEALREEGGALGISGLHIKSAVGWCCS